MSNTHSVINLKHKNEVKVIDIFQVSKNANNSSYKKKYDMYINMLDQYIQSTNLKFEDIPMHIMHDSKMQEIVFKLIDKYDASLLQDNKNSKHNLFFLGAYENFFHEYRIKKQDPICIFTGVIKLQHEDDVTFELDSKINEFCQSEKFIKSLYENKVFLHEDKFPIIVNSFKNNNSVLYVGHLYLVKKITKDNYSYTESSITSLSNIANEIAGRHDRLSIILPIFNSNCLFTTLFKLHLCKRLLEGTKSNIEWLFPVCDEFTYDVITAINVALVNKKIEYYSEKITEEKNKTFDTFVQEVESEYKLVEFLILKNNTVRLTQKLTNKLKDQNNKIRTNNGLYQDENIKHELRLKNYQADIHKEIDHGKTRRMKKINKLLKHESEQILEKAKKSDSIVAKIIITELSNLTFKDKNKSSKETSESSSAFSKISSPYLIFGIMFLIFLVSCVLSLLTFFLIRYIKNKRNKDDKKSFGKAKNALAV
jgi:hypothetical protein